MITDEVIKEIYKKHKKPPKKQEDLQLEHFIELLKPQHDMSIDGTEIVIKDMEPDNPFSRFLIRGLTAIIEFDKMVAFVLRDHIIFFEKNGPGVHVHFKPVTRSGLLKRLFGKK